MNATYAENTVRWRRKSEEKKGGIGLPFKVNPTLSEIQISHEI